MTVDPYLDPATGTLRNRLGISDPERLAQAEADITFAALADLGVRIVPGNYDLAHLQSFHLEIFGDIYPWAGEIRTVGIARTDPFCLPQHIHDYSADVFSGLHKENHLRQLSRTIFVDRVTHYFAEVNAIHPFREGNGRAQRAFFHQLCRQAGWVIDWAGLNAEQNAAASQAALRGNNLLLQVMLDSLIVPE